MKKLILYPIYFVFIASILVGAAFYLTPLPYMPVNRFLDQSPDISGKVSGSVLTGVTIKNLKINGKPDGHILIEKISFRYQGLSYLFLNKLVIKEIEWQGMDGDVAMENYLHIGQIQREFKKHVYLIPPLPRKQISSVHIKNFTVKDINLRMRSNGPSSLGMSSLAFPLMMMTSGLFSKSMGGGMPPAANIPGSKDNGKSKMDNFGFRLDDFLISNIRIEKPGNNKPYQLKLTQLKDLIFEKDRFDLGLFESQSESLDLKIVKSPDSGDTWKNSRIDISGTIKENPENNFYRDIGFSGQIVDEGLSLSSFDGKIKLTSIKPAGSIIPSIKLAFDQINLTDYFKKVAPIKNLSYTFNYPQGSIDSASNLATFGLGAGSFVGRPEAGPNRMPQGEAKVFLYAQQKKNKNVNVAVLLDKKVPGHIRLSLSKTYPITRPVYLLSQVWYGKNMTSLKKNELETLKSIAVYFGINEKEFAGFSKGKRKK